MCAAPSRICAGYNFANQSLFIDIACLLWAFNIRKAKDPKTGVEITPDPDDFRDGGLVLYVPSLRAVRPVGRQTY